MAGLPQLTETTRRKLAIQWEALMDTHRLTGEYIDRYAAVTDSVRRIALDKAPETQSPWLAGWLLIHERSKRESGISPSVEAAQRRFGNLASEYWVLWDASGTEHETYAGQVELLKGQVLDELASVWRGRSDAATRWFETGCRPALDIALSNLVKAQVSKARNAVLIRLTRQPILSANKPPSEEVNMACKDATKEAMNNPENPSQETENFGGNTSPGTPVADYVAEPRQTPDAAVAPLAEEPLIDSTMMSAAIVGDHVEDRAVANRPRMASDDEPPTGDCRATKWEDIEIIFLSDHTLQIKLCSRIQPPQNYAEMGFASRKSQKPVLAWETLRALASTGGVIGKPPAGQTWAAVEKRIEEIREKFKAKFGLAARGNNRGLPA